MFNHRRSRQELVVVCKKCLFYLLPLFLFFISLMWFFPFVFFSFLFIVVFITGFFFLPAVWWLMICFFAPKVCHKRATAPEAAVIRRCLLLHFFLISLFISLFSILLFFFSVSCPSNRPLHWSSNVCCLCGCFRCVAYYL